MVVVKSLDDVVDEIIDDPFSHGKKKSDEDEPRVGNLEKEYIDKGKQGDPSKSSVDKINNALSFSILHLIFLLSNRGSRRIHCYLKHH